MLPFVGATLSARIIDYREKHGGYDSVGQLVEIYGIGPKSLEKIRPYLILRITRDNSLSFQIDISVELPAGIR